MGKCESGSEDERKNKFFNQFSIYIVPLNGYGEALTL